MSALGASHDPDTDTWTVSLWAPHAVSVDVVVVDRSAPFLPVLQRSLVRAAEPDVWTVDIPAADIGEADLYGFRVDGRWAPLAGDRFDRSKVLLDPRATAVWFPPGADRDLARVRGVDTLGRSPLGVLERRPAIGDTTSRPRLLDDQLVVYEAHVGHLTRSATSHVVAPGTFHGLMDKLDHLAALGVTVLELLPVHPNDPQEGSVWGYMPLGFLAIEPRYAVGDDAAGELVDLVNACHQRGIEVVLDVVYNHSTEEDHLGPTYSQRGIDSRGYYVMNDVGEYANESGCGNVLRAANDRVADLIVDALERMADLGVDGFRFDLASILGRDHDGTPLTSSPTIDRITAWAHGRGVRLIAEPWDVGVYQVGDAFPGRTWMQWNGRFRDDVRSFVRGDAGMVPALVQRVQGSPDIFPDTPMRSVNFVTAHDGFTLHDLVSHDRKHNEANGNANTDGTDDNRSWNCGWEGIDGAPADVVALRHRQMRNFMVLLMMSAGVPMMLAGDEIAHSQRGNNNAYNRDDDSVWIDWHLSDDEAALQSFVSQMIAMRRSHPSIGRTTHWADDVSFLGPDGVDWLAPDSRAFGWHLRGGSEGDDDIVVLANAGVADVDIRLPVVDAVWFLVADTARDPDVFDFGSEQRVDAEIYTVASRSTVVLVSQPVR